MKLSALLAIAAIVAVAFGVGFVVVSGPLLALYGVTLDKAGTLIAQLFGAALIGLGVINWSARSAPDEGRFVVLGNLVGDAAGFVVALLGQLAGVANALGWSTVALYLVLGLAFAYFQFMAPSSSAARMPSRS
ncbi:MAG TPA: hypothetical protein VI056_05000 [Candidatus Limnocylindria bacterium]